MTSARRSEIARKASRSRWTSETAASAPIEVRRLLKSYDPARLRWATVNDRYAIVRAVLLHGDSTARSWLRRKLSDDQVRALISRNRGAGCNEPERERLRVALGLTTQEIPIRPNATQPEADGVRASLPQLVRDLFWSYDFASLSLSRDKDLVLLHVLTYGNRRQKQWLIRQFGRAGIRRWIVEHEGRGLSVEQMSPWVSKATALRWVRRDPYKHLWEAR